MNTDFTRENARGSPRDAQAEITPHQICGALPKEFDPKAYAARPWEIAAYTRDGDQFDLGGRTLKVIAAPGQTPDAISLIWCDPVNIFEWLVWFLHLSFRGQGQPQPWQVMATIDQADIRGSKPHNHDPSGAASD